MMHGNSDELITVVLNTVNINLAIFGGVSTSKKTLKFQNVIKRKILLECYPNSEHI